MRARYNKEIILELDTFDRLISSKEKLQEILKQNSDQKIYVEIGMGKGDFISQMALNDPENLYIGVEIAKPILAIAVRKLKKKEQEQQIHINNLYVMSFDAIEIAEIFEEHQIDKIYLNFSDPWPKKKHAKRRLTNEAFLKEYQKVLKKQGRIELKTDNRKLFEYSLVSMQNFGLTFLEVYLDLHQTDIPNVMTEYEERFSKLGPIYKLVAMQEKNDAYTFEKI